MRSKFDGFDRELYTDAFVVTVGPDCDIDRISVHRDGRLEDEIDVGNAQDSDETGSSSLVVGAGAWSEPMEEKGTFFRRIGGEDLALGQARFSLWFFYPTSEYTLTMTYRSTDRPVHVRIARGAAHQETSLPAGPGWQTAALELELAADSGEEETATTLSRWPGVRGLRIESVRMLDELGQDQAVFEVHKPLRVQVQIVADEQGTFPLIPAALVFRLDGIVATRHVGDRAVLELAPGDRIDAELAFGPLLLGNGTHLLSVGLYRELEITNTLSSSAYDYFDRSFEFMVVGNPPLHTEAFRHPGAWTLSTTPLALEEASVAKGAT